MWKASRRHETAPSLPWASVLWNEAPLVASMIKATVPTMKEIAEEMQADEEFQDRFMQTSNALFKKSVIDTISDDDFAATVRSQVTPWVRKSFEESVPMVQDIAVETLKNEDFTMKIRTTLGPLIRASVMDTLCDEEYCSRVTNITAPIMKKSVMDTLSDDAFTSDVLDSVEIKIFRIRSF